MASGLNVRLGTLAWRAIRRLARTKSESFNVSYFGAADEKANLKFFLCKWFDQDENSAGRGHKVTGSSLKVGMRRREFIAQLRCCAIQGWPPEKLELLSEKAHRLQLPS
jgi:hypothetical protein